MINENTKKRIKFLAGLLKEEIRLISSPSKGRSDAGTLNYYIEQYLLDISSRILNSLQDKYSDFKIDSSSTKIYQNTLILKFYVRNNDFLLTAIVSPDNNLNTSVSISNNGKTEKFNLNSKHNFNDTELFIQEIVDRV
jgi:hypothetical protein